MELFVLHEALLGEVRPAARSAPAETSATLPTVRESPGRGAKGDCPVLG